MATVAIQLGIAVAGAVLSAVFAPTPPPQEGPRLNDLNLPAVNPGNPIPRLYGRMALGTQLIWTTGLKETRHEKKVKGGKGGGKAQKVITYTYSSDIAIAIAEGAVDQIRRIWANNKILYQGIIYTGEDAQKAIDAAGYAASLSSDLSDNRDETDGEAKAKAKKKLNALLDRLNEGMTKLLTALTELEESTGFLTDPRDDFVEWATDTVKVGEPGTTTYDKDAGLSFIDALIGALDTAAQMLEQGAVGTENAYLEGQAEQYVDGKASELQRVLTNDERNAYIAEVMQKKGMAGDDSDKRFDRINLYNGTRSQMPDDIIEADKGIGMVPAYRGICYFVVDELQLADFGNTLPTFRVEIARGDGDGKTSLIEIVNDLCFRAGLDAEEFATEEMTDQPIGGFAVTRTASARELLEIVRNVHHFDVIEKNFKVHFIDRYTRPVARLRRHDFAATEFDSDPITMVDITRGQVSEFPKEINLTYQDPGRDYSVGTARSKRQAQTLANGVEKIELPMALTPEEAKLAADKLMTYRWSARRSYKIVLPIKYAILDPGDCVHIPDKLVPTRDNPYRVEAMNIGANHLIEFTLVDHVAPKDGITALAYVQPQREAVKQFSGNTDATLLDVPILSDTEDDTVPGIYVVFSSPGNTWPGGTLYTDSGSGGAVPLPGGGENDASDAVSWELSAVSGFNTPRVKLIDDMPAASPYLWDRTTRLRVFVLSNAYSPTTLPEATILRSQSNTLVVNGEVCQFARATSLGDNVFELRDFIRGQRGTESFIAMHPAGTNAVAITTEGVQRVEHSASQLNIPLEYITANAGRDINEFEPFQFVDTGNSLRPYAPAHVRRSDQDNGDMILSWLPRVRQKGTWTDGGDPPIDQPTEQYEIDIYDDAVFKRTLYVDSARQVVYTSAMQAEDFGGLPPVGGMTVKAYQIGAVIGRGFTNPIQL